MQPVQRHRINNIIVKPPKEVVADCSSVSTPSSALFSEEFFNVLLLAKKKTGKTSTIFTILKNSIINTKKVKTIVIIYCNTVYKDKTWIAITNWLNEKGIPSVVNTSIHEDGVNTLDNILDVLGTAEGDSLLEKGTENL